MYVFVIIPLDIFSESTGTTIYTIVIIIFFKQYFPVSVTFFMIENVKFLSFLTINLALFLVYKVIIID